LLVKDKDVFLYDKIFGRAAAGLGCPWSKYVSMAAIGVRLSAVLLGGDVGPELRIA